MSYYARVINGIVDKVIVAEPEFFDTFVDSSPGEWIKASKDGSIRKNYPGIGMEYDSTRDAFIPSKPHESWTLNETTCKWEAPVTMPDDGKRYIWNEDTQAWDETKPE